MPILFYFSILMPEQPDMIVERSGATSFAFTLRKTTTKKGQPTKEDYLLHWEKIGSECHLKETCFEKTGGLHMHGVLEIPKHYPMYKFRVRGWKIHFEEIWDYDGWRRYMAKEAVIKDHEEDYPIRKLRRSLFRDRSTAPAVIPDGITAPLSPTPPEGQ